LRLGSWLVPSWLADRYPSKSGEEVEKSSLGIVDPINMVKRAVLDKARMKVTDIIPRLKDGGAFVKFSHPAEISAAEIEGEIIMNSLIPCPLAVYSFP
jgi:hypothetical protein